MQFHHHAGPLHRHTDAQTHTERARVDEEALLVAANIGSNEKNMVACDASTKQIRVGRGLMAVLVQL